ncbi:helix-turn-helix domain-containing protein [Paenibacillus contaminans]|uniref:HTH araC/xylS-type domain-containing protein n=1 Tax=Paenibacillus contaminans TaxID=450362 RepID=A0A329MUL9_9BACL|nr:helix-turn-helix domain-containing protein [Paenibacillus contaminans]RAV21657.1 hypothetical protein DQG23_10420 [Paenibacillus contaminans]
MSNFTFWRKINLSYKQQLFVYSLLLSIIPVLLVGFASSYISTKIVREEVNNNQQMTLQQLQYQVDTFLYNIERTSQQIAGDLTVEKSLRIGISMDNPEALDTTLDLRERIRNYRSFSDISFDLSLVYLKHHYVYSNRDGIMKEEEFPFYQLLQKEKLPSVGSLVISPNVYPNQKDLLLIKPIQSSAAPPEGMLVMEIDAKRFYEFFLSLQIGNNSKVMIVDNLGRIVMSQNQNESGSQINSLSALYPLWTGDVTNPQPVTIQDTKYKVSVQKSSFNQWTYIAMTPITVLNAKSDVISKITWIVVAALAVLWSGISFFGSKRLYFPIQRLAVKFLGANKSGDGLQDIDYYIDDTLKTTQQLKDQINDHLPDLKGTILLQLLRGDISEQEFHNKSRHYDFPLRGRWFYVCAVQIDQYDAFKQKYVGRDRPLMMFALAKLIQEICEVFHPCLTVVPQPGQVAFIMGLEEADTDTDAQLSEVCDAIRSKVSEYFNLSVTVAMSRPHRDLRNISESYNEALELLQYRFWLGENRTVSAQNTENLGSIQQTSRQLGKWEKLIVKSISEGELAKAEEQLDDMIRTIPKTESNSTFAIGYFARLIGEIDGLLEESGAELGSMFDYDLYKRLYACDSLAELQDWFGSEFFPTLRTHMGQLNGSHRKWLVQQAIGFIHERFETDLSLQQIADHLEVPAYQLSRLFKDETEMNFVDYVIHYRISKAKEWLALTDMSIKEITERLRYATTQNFTRVFKQITGVPPGKYRTERR